VSFSTEVMVLFTRENSSQWEYLLKWSPLQQAFEFVGGHQESDETARECAIGRTSEQLDGLEETDFLIGKHPVARLRDQVLSQHAGGDTLRDTTLFSGEIQPSALPRLKQVSKIAWATEQVIAVGKTTDGRRISLTAQLALAKTGRLADARDQSMLTIGVTGHRDLDPDQLPDLIGRIHNLFDHAEEISHRRPLRLLSPLAVGADQLVAQVALTRGIRLIAPLPLPIDDYEQDFSEPERVEFYRLLEEAEEWFSLPIEPDAERSTCYAEVGRYVVNHSDLLIALWDGEINHKEGGTAATLQYALETSHNGRPPLRIGLFSVERNSS